MSEQTGSTWTTSLDIDHGAFGPTILTAMREWVAVVDHDFRFVVVNDVMAEALGRGAEELLGTAATEVVAPADRDRAALMLRLAAEQGAPPGTASFGVIWASGSIVSLDLTTVDIELDGTMMIAVVGRPSARVGAIHTVLDRMLGGATLADVVEPVLDFFAWRQAGSMIAIAWAEPGGSRSVSTGVPEALCGHLDTEGADIWAQAWRTGEAVQGPAAELLDPERLEVAAGLDRQGLWIEPIAGSGTGVDAVITVLGGPFAPEIHAFGVDEARRVLSVVMRWHGQTRVLEAAALRDELTGLANRRAFFNALSAGLGGGAVLFTDLDSFKSVNDHLGHAHGDALLIETGRRILGAVREGDLVARIGGDEFGVVLRGASTAEADGAATRIRVACSAPFEVGGATVVPRISVGVAHDETELSEATLAAADRDQYADKRRGTPEE